MFCKLSDVFENLESKLFDISIEQRLVFCFVFVCVVFSLGLRGVGSMHGFIIVTAYKKEKNKLDRAISL